VYYEIHSEAENAMIREKQMKKWRRPWKIELIEEKNPGWKDVYEDIL
jgi:putative endonuclease